jgi:hypothetical protein
MQVFAIDLLPSEDPSDRDPLVIKNWGLSHGLSFPLLIDSDNFVWNQYGMGYIPHNVVLDTAMKVLYTNYGYEKNLLISLIDNYYSPVNLQDANLNSIFMDKGVDTLMVNAMIKNDDNHSMSVFAIITSTDKVYSDTLELYDDGNHSDGQADDNVYGGVILPISEEHEFIVGIKTIDLDYQVVRIWEEVDRFSTVGPVVFEEFIQTSRIQNRIFLKLVLRNIGSQKAADNVSATLSTTDPLVTTIAGNNQQFGTIEAGGIAESSGNYLLFTSGMPDIHTINFTINIAGNGKPYWQDESSAIVGLQKHITVVPQIFSLDQNFPNPFNPQTTIKYVLDTVQPQHTRLQILNSLGQTVRILVDVPQIAGEYQVNWDGKDNFKNEVASGIYYYQLTSGQMEAVRKMILMR